MQFKLGLESISLGPEDRFYMHNTVICPVGVFEKLAKSAELKTHYRNVNGKGRMALHILEAAA
jgi:hypothetical protein